ncbi:hypothetical protein BJX68DRAFT_249887 [Aspergillus pseudodeflectus]|uniref:leucine--tRNA ligase n=1 Tax=Aspergillus pseudodeflectus TaxID=176178 RepID=A0ABR4JB32_9EURO
MQALCRLRLSPPGAAFGCRAAGTYRLPPRSPPNHTYRALATATATASSQHRKLDLVALDKKWQAKWQEEAKTKRAAASSGSEPAARGQEKPKSYILSMFPYPSGTLHMGHLRVYTISDVLARFYRMRGHEVLHPMGWDAFGLPAENAAIERGVDPAGWTTDNIKRMKEQLRSISTSFDWDRELATCAPEFYKHTQRVFLMLYEKGLAYQAEAMVNYDPVDKTVLANEQVDANGFSWRSGAKVEKKLLKQWFFRITAFKEQLLEDLDSLSGGWPERVLSMQRNWLGKSYGAKIKFPLVDEGSDGRHVDVNVFTTRPDTLYGVEYIALSLDHPIVLEAAKEDEGLRTFLSEAAMLPPDSKVGYKLKYFCVNPLNSIDKESPHLARRLPVYVAPYVLSDYGEGAVMGVPGHDARDFAFFKVNANPHSIPVILEAEQQSVSDRDRHAAYVPINEAKPFTQEGFLTTKCGKYQGLHSREAGKLITADLKATGRAEFVEQWRLRDWLISRQRYWGAPIPIIHCGDCGPVPVPADQLPVKLPDLQGDWLKGKRGNPLESSEDWKNCKCPSCGGAAKRDTDTMDTFVDSSWYYLRFLDAANKQQPFSPSLARPVDVYIGGVEHAILHLLYARFIYKFLSQSNFFPEIVHSGALAAPAEPFKTLLSQGMVHGKTYTEPSTGRFLLPSEVDLSNGPDKPLIKGTQITPNVSFEKMSKSKHNGVDPTTCVSKYGADATRAHVLFSAPVSEVLEWDESKIVGMERWFARLWKLVMDTEQSLSSSSYRIEQADDLSDPLLPSLSDNDAEAILSTHRVICSVTNCIETNPYGLNTVISDLTKLTNTLLSSPPTSPHISYLTVSSLLRLLAPVAPSLSSECWEILHSSLVRDRDETSIFNCPWPAPPLTVEQADVLSARGGQVVAVQINGKLRFTVTIPRMLSPTTPESSVTEQQDYIITRILETEQGRLWLREKNDWEKHRRVIVVKGGKLVNIVF